MLKYLILITLCCCTHGHVYDSGVLSEIPDSVAKEEVGRELIYLQILASNGQYAPLSLYPNDANTENDWPNGIGVLTQLGKLQQFEFGKFLRKFYGSFITSNPIEMDAFSSREDRSTMSLLTLMSSLYEPTEEYQFFPGLKWQPITMCFLEDDVHDPFFGYQDDCSAQESESKRILSSEPIQEIMKKDEFLYSYWTNNSGSPIESIRDVADLYDTIQKEKEAGLLVPFWARTHLHDMKRISNLAYKWYYNSVLSLQLKVGLLMDFLRIRMQVHPMPENPTPDLKVSVYMTHDWKIAAVLSSMRLFNGIRPPPSATLTFELYRQPRQDDDDTYDYSVRTLYFNSNHPELGYQEPNLLILEGCGSEFCPLAHFIRFFDYVVPDNYTILCDQLEQTTSMEVDTEEPNIYPMYHDILQITEAPVRVTRR